LNRNLTWLSGHPHRATKIQRVVHIDPATKVPSKLLEGRTSSIMNSYVSNECLVAHNRYVRLVDDIILITSLTACRLPVLVVRFGGPYGNLSRLTYARNEKIPRKIPPRRKNMVSKEPFRLACYRHSIENHL